MASSFRSDDAIISGSLTKLSNGSSYLVAGEGITIITGALGDVTISSDSYNTVGDYGNDVKILLSGAAGTKDTSTRGVTLITGDTAISGSTYFYDDLNLEVNKAIYFNNPGGTADQYIKSIFDVFLQIEADDYLQVNADENIDMRVGVGSNDSRFEMDPKQVAINRTTLISTTTDFSVNDNLLFVSGGDGAVTIGTGPTIPNYGLDTLVYITGSKGFKDQTASRNVVVIPGDLVVSGNIYGSESDKTFTKDVKFTSLSLNNVTDNNRIFFDFSDVGYSNSVGQDQSFIAPFSGSFNKLIIRTTSSSKFNGAGGLTASFHLGKEGTTAIDIDVTPDFLEEVRSDAYPLSNVINLPFNFSGSFFEPGDCFAVGLKSDNNWNAGGTFIGVSATFVVSYLVE